MKPIINFFAGLSLFSGVTTGLMVVLNEKMMIGPMFGVTVALIGIAIGAKYIDWRMRNNLIQLLSSAESRVDYADYLRIVDLKYEIRAGLSLTAAASKIGELAHELDFDAEIEGAV